MEQEVKRVEERLHGLMEMGEGAGLGNGECRNREKVRETRAGKRSNRNNR